MHCKPSPRALRVKPLEAYKATVLSGTANTAQKRHPTTPRRGDNPSLKDIGGNAQSATVLTSN